MTEFDYAAALPEIVLAIFAMAALLLGAFAGKDRLTPALTWATATVFIVLAVWIGYGGPGGDTAFQGGFVNDAFARFAKVTILLSAAAVLAMSEDYMRRKGLGRFEYPVLVALAVGDQRAIPRGHHVHFDEIGALRNRQLIGGQRMFRAMPARPPMCDD